MNYIYLMNIRISKESSSSSDSLYYSPNNSESDSPNLTDPIDNSIGLSIEPLIEHWIESSTLSSTKPLIKCNCINSNESCLIFCYNQNTNEFESIDCKKFDLIH